MNHLISDLVHLVSHLPLLLIFGILIFAMFDISRSNRKRKREDWNRNYKALMTTQERINYEKEIFKMKTIKIQDRVSKKMNENKIDLAYKAKSELLELKESFNLILEELERTERDQKKECESNTPKFLFPSLHGSLGNYGSIGVFLLVCCAGGVLYCVISGYFILGLIFLILGIIIQYIF